MTAYPTEPLFPGTVFRELARPLQHPEALCWDPQDERAHGEDGREFLSIADLGVRGSPLRLPTIART